MEPARTEEGPGEELALDTFVEKVALDTFVEKLVEALVVDRFSGEELEVEPACIEEAPGVELAQDSLGEGLVVEPDRNPEELL